MILTGEEFTVRVGSKFLIRERDGAALDVRSDTELEVKQGHGGKEEAGRKVAAQSGGLRVLFFSLSLIADRGELDYG